MKNNLHEWEVVNNDHQVVRRMAVPGGYLYDLSDADVVRHVVFTPSTSVQDYAHGLVIRMAKAITSSAERIHSSGDTVLLTTKLWDELIGLIGLEDDGYLSDDIKRGS